MRILDVKLSQNLQTIEVDVIFYIKLTNITNAWIDLIEI